LGERVVRNDEVSGSIPLSSTIPMKIKDLTTGFAWWDNQVGHLLVQSDLSTALPARHILLSLAPASLFQIGPADVVHQGVASYPRAPDSIAASHGLELSSQKHH
jgi:hypothetical protein